MSERNWHPALEPLRKYAVFRGRARRAEFWKFILLCWIVQKAFDILDGSFGRDATADFGLGWIFSLFILLPSIAVGWRRMHDVGRPGWLSVIWAFPLLVIFSISSAFGDDREARTASGGGPVVEAVLIVGFICIIGSLCYYLYLAVKEGNCGSNQYGEDPKGRVGEYLTEVFR